MKRCGVARRGIHVSDGVVNVALLKKEKDDERIGIAHFGMWVDDLDTAEWKTTSPATTKARITSSSGRLEPAGTDTGPSLCGRSSIVTTSPLQHPLGVRLGVLIAGVVSVGFHP